MEVCNGIHPEPEHPTISEKLVSMEAPMQPHNISFSRHCISEKLVSMEVLLSYDIQ